MTDAAFCHDLYTDRFHNFLDQCRVRHAGYPAVFANIGRYPLQGHNRNGTGFFGNYGVLYRYHVHNYPPF